MKIIKLTAENVKKLRAVEITPTGDLVEITGRNGAGKTSVLGAIWWAMAGTKHIQAVPIRKGQDRARIRLDLGELIVERRFTAAGSTLTVESAEGARYKSPQGVLDALLGALTFDPLAFVGQAPREQFEALRADLDAAERVNRGVEQRQRKATLLARVAEQEAAAKALTETMEARARAKADAIARAPMPVPGLGFGDGVVTLGGIPFDQASTAEQLRVSVAIAMAANPRLRVILIKEGSLLDDDNLALIAAMARERDYQVWLEKVDTSGKVGVVIEDGAVVAVDGQPVTAPTEART